MATDQGNVLRRKLAAAWAELAEGGPGADRSWRVALARAARDALKLVLEVQASSLDRCSLAELLELAPERALIAVLEGPGESLGVIVLSPEVLAGMIEMQTIGKVNPGPPLPRRPTRTDAAMVAGMIEAALTGLEIALAEEADLVWAGGFRYASFLDDPRPLGLLLEDGPYRVLRTQVSLGLGAKSGEVLLALPAEGRGERPQGKPEAAPQDDHGPAFTHALAERVAGADCRLQAVLARLSLPLAQVLSLTEGMVLALPMAAIDRICLEGIDGRGFGEGRLGQNRGMRAVRLVERPAGTIGAGSAAAGRNATLSPRPPVQPEAEMLATGTG